ncbi:sodium/sugar symporter [Sediminitomix flava]|uniref:SSS family solute:Na+ symporter n=1 Tax=Sediminitomix flava TaxID=379075 RepID=A0A315YY63_SEDFL|nr:sodium/sugar symporter [Sediminitomix flava]PWJ34997.1 SSS family solute:Na+ symporter [Sediminitomix flava]
MGNFSFWDYAVFVGYGLVILCMGLWVSRDKKGESKSAEDYFLASKSLPWWAIGASLIASNISAEQFIGMSGSGFAIGLAISCYEWIAAASLILVGKYFLPIFLKKEIYTMPQFLKQRFDGRVSMSLSVFWLLVYVFVNLTSVLYMGALSMNIIMGVPMMYGIIGLALFAAVYSIYGGLSAVAWTDVVQVVVLVFGGLLTTYLALDALSIGNGIWAGVQTAFEAAPEKFKMIVEKGTMIPDGSGGFVDAYDMLPGLGALLGGIWIVNLAYWGLNQYIIQRALAGKSLKEAQTGVVFAGYLKLLMPLIVVLPGIIAFVINQDPMAYNLSGSVASINGTEGADVAEGFMRITKSDEAYPWLLSTFIPTGLKGLAFAALTAAIVSSLASMINSTSTIFTMDIYKGHINVNAADNQLVKIGRIVSVIALVLAVCVAPMLGALDQAFQFIQEFTGLVTPGVLVIFTMGLFWKRANANGAFTVAALTFPLSWGAKMILPSLPFLDRMFIVCLILAVVGVGVSLLTKKENKGISLEKGLFKTDGVFNALSIGICGILTVLYLIFW